MSWLCVVCGVTRFSAWRGRERRTRHPQPHPRPEGEGHVGRATYLVTTTYKSARSITVVLEKRVGLTGIFISPSSIAVMRRTRKSA